MRFLKKLGRLVASSLLKFSLLLLPVVASLVAVFGTPVHIKQALKQSNVYSTFVDSAISAAQRDSTKKELNQIPLDRPEIKAVFNSAFPPELIQSSSEQIIDGFYGWLNGKSQNPNFSIDLSAQKTTLANSIADYAVGRAKTLPACSPQQARQLLSSGLDFYNVTCLPPGVSLASIHDQVSQQISGNTDFLSSAVISTDNIPRDKNGKTTFEKASRVRQLFQWSKPAPYVLGVVAILSALLLVSLHDDRRRGMRNIALMLLGTSLILFLGTWILGRFMANSSLSSGSLGKFLYNDFQQNLMATFRSLDNSFNHRLYLFCAVYAAVGIIILIPIGLTGFKKPSFLEKKDPLRPGSTIEPTPDLPAPKQQADEATKEDKQDPINDIFPTNPS